MEDSKIEWTKSTFGPWIGCTKVGPGCDHCYAERMDARGIYGGQKHWGPGVPRYRTSEANWNQVRRWNRQAPESEFAGRKGFWPVFSASQADIFDNEIDPAWRADFWALVRECQNLTFQIVTKRIGNAPRMLPADWGTGYPNVWLLSTIVNQEEADRDIPKLLSVPAVIHGLSMEPLLGPVNLRCIRWERSERGFLDATDGTTTYNAAPSSDSWSPNLPALSWTIVGGESGKNARPMHPDWARSLRDQCAAAGVPFLFKQWGEWHTRAVRISDGAPAFRQFETFDRWVSKAPTWVSGGICLDRNGRDLKIGADFMRARDDGSFPVTVMHRTGKKAAGRLLDGRTWDEYPEKVEA